MVFGLRSTAGKDGALLVGSVVASTAVSMVAAPVIALVKARIETLLEFLGIAQSGRGKFAFDFLWGSFNGALVQAIMSPFRVLSDGYRFATIASLMFDGSEAPGSLSEYAAEQYAKGGLAAFCETRHMLILNWLKYFPSQAINFVMKDKIKSLFPKYNPKTDFPKFFAANMASGGLAGAVSLSVVYPIDYVRTKIEIAFARKRWSGSGPLTELDKKLVESKTMIEAAGHIVNEQGILSMYSGYGVSVFGIVAYRGPYFGLFDFLKTANPWKTDKGRMGLASKFVIAQTTAIFASGISFPMDVVRRGLQVAPDLSALEVASKVYDAKGLLGFWTGFGLNVARTIAGAILKVLIDEIKNFLKGKAYLPTAPSASSPNSCTAAAPTRSRPRSGRGCRA